MAKKRAEKQKENGVIITFTVAECGEYHNFGEYHEGIQTLEEAIRIFNTIPPERMNGIPAIGINLHVEGTESWEDSQVDVFTGEGIDMGMLKLSPEIYGHPKAQEAVKQLIELFPDKEIIDF